MKKMKWRIGILLVFSVMFVLLMSVNSVVAEGVSSLKIDIQADKAEYKKNEVAKLTITVENTSDQIASDVSIANILPNGLVYAPQQKESTFRHAEILPHTSVQHEVYVKMVDVQIPQTGDASRNVPIMLGMVVASIAVLAVLHKKQTVV